MRPHRRQPTRLPHPWDSPGKIPPRTIPLGRPSAPAPSIQYRASNLDWRLVSYMILYIFQCHSPKSQGAPRAPRRDSRGERSPWPSQCTSPKNPVSCIEPGLATHFIYDIIHISMPFSQIHFLTGSIPTPLTLSSLSCQGLASSQYSVLTPSIQYCASNLDWRLVSYMILYMFQCHSPKSSHPLPLPQSP